MQRAAGTSNQQRKGLSWKRVKTGKRSGFDKRRKVEEKACPGVKDGELQTRKRSEMFGSQLCLICLFLWVTHWSCSCMLQNAAGLDRDGDGDGDG